MSMSKQDFVALADSIRHHNDYATVPGNKMVAFTADQIATLASFCQGQNSRFMEWRWLDYIAGRCGKNGGKVK